MSNDQEGEEAPLHRTNLILVSEAHKPNKETKSSTEQNLFRHNIIANGAQ